MGRSIYQNASLPCPPTHPWPSPPLYTRLKWLRVCVCTHTHSMRDLGCLIKSRLELSNTHSSGADARRRAKPCVTADSEEEGREGGVYSDEFPVKVSKWKRGWRRVGWDRFQSDAMIIWGFVWPVDVSLSVTAFLFYQWHFDLKERKSHQNIRELGNYLTVISHKRNICCISTSAFQGHKLSLFSVETTLLFVWEVLCSHTQFSVSLTIKINTKYIYTTVQTFEVIFFICLPRLHLFDQNHSKRVTLWNITI